MDMILFWNDYIWRKGVICNARVLIRLIEIFHKFGICSLFTRKCNFDVVPGKGICTLFLSPIVGFLYERPAPPWGICNFSKTKWQMPGGMGTHGIDWGIILATKCFCRWDCCVTKEEERESGQPITEWNMMKYVTQLMRSVPSGSKFLADAVTVMLSVKTIT